MQAEFGVFIKNDSTSINKVGAGKHAVAQCASAGLFCASMAHLGNSRFPLSPKSTLWLLVGRKNIGSCAT